LTSWCEDCNKNDSFFLDFLPSKFSGFGCNISRFYRAANATELAIQPENSHPQELSNFNLAYPAIASASTSTDLISANPISADSMNQVTSVSQLSDVQPTDWAFQALQSLVERYGCIAGYPDGTYRGNRALTRYEFAAGVNACLDRINELIEAGTRDLVTKEDLNIL
jgi:hypothetical protein